MMPLDGPFIGRTTWLLRQFRKQIWVRAAMFSLAAVATAVLAAIAEPLIPYDFNLTLAAGSVGNILDILASSMLAVTTFSLSVMVSAYSAAAANVTPRSTKLLLSDSVAQNTLATFIGSFLFSIVGIIGLAAGFYSDKGRIILFGATLAVLLIIAGTLLRWIEQLGKFGRVGDTIKRVEEAATEPAGQWGSRPRLGARPWTMIPYGASEVMCLDVGYVRHIDMAALADIAANAGVTIHIDVIAGSFVHAARPVAYVSPPAHDDCAARIAKCITIGADREYDQDPRFGLIVLSEIASRALSPAVNDPGTAIEVIGAGLRVMLAYGDARSEPQEPCFEGFTPMTWHRATSSTISSIRSPATVRHWSKFRCASSSLSRRWRGTTRRFMKTARGHMRRWRSDGRARPGCLSMTSTVSRHALHGPPPRPKNRSGATAAADGDKKGSDTMSLGHHALRCCGNPDRARGGACLYQSPLHRPADQYRPDNHGRCRVASRGRARPFAAGTIGGRRAGIMYLFADHFELLIKVGFQSSEPDGGTRRKRSFEFATL